MSIQEQAESFLAQDRIAVVGVSRSAGTGNGIYKRMRSCGLNAFPVNPLATEIDGEPCYPNLAAIPGGVDAVMIVTRPEVTEKMVQEAAEIGATHVWMHYNALFGEGNSSASDSAVVYCREHGIDVIAGGCPMMFGPTADFGHKCMRFVLNAAGKLPSAV